MFESFLTDQSAQTIAILPITKANFTSWFSKQDAMTQKWLLAANFTAEPGQISLIPTNDGTIKQVLLGIDGHNSLWSLADCPKVLPAGSYHIQDEFQLLNLKQAILGWGLACYRFDHYLTVKTIFNRQLVVDATLLAEISPMLEAIFLVRNLITTPAEDMGPEQISLEAKRLAERYRADFHEIIGPDLLEQGYAGIYTVGRAAAQSPRLIDIKWGNACDPKITLVGKGVCFDSGGLDLKAPEHMLLMKKDMGGAAHALGLAKLIMAAKLPIRLRVLIPAVENAISKDAYRPGDIIKSRNGITIEVGNTDAEGRIILADALAEASTEKPELLLDFATLTGAARVALGTSLPALFSNRKAIANELMELGEQESDPLWALPLHAPYKRFIKGKFADLTNNPSTGMGGAITAALFLECFVGENIPWLHLDLMAWNDSTQPGRPEGGEAMSLRTLFAYLCKCYGAKHD